MGRHHQHGRYVMCRSCKLLAAWGALAVGCGGLVVWSDAAAPDASEADVGQCSGIPSRCEDCLGECECDRQPGCNIQLYPCSGTPSPCGVRDAAPISCEYGCYLSDGACYGVPQPCRNTQGNFECLAAGCAWALCSGTPIPCSMLSSRMTCVQQFGCRWQ